MEITRKRNHILLHLQGAIFSFPVVSVKSYKYSIRLSQRKALFLYDKRVVPRRVSMCFSQRKTSFYNTLINNDLQIQRMSYLFTFKIHLFFANIDYSQSIIIYKTVLIHLFLYPVTLPSVQSNTSIVANNYLKTDKPHNASPKMCYLCDKIVRDAYA